MDTQKGGILMEKDGQVYSTANVSPVEVRFQQQTKRLGYLGFGPLVAFFILAALLWFLGGGPMAVLAETTAVIHYVTDTGTDLNACTPTDPCSLERAVSLAVAGDEIRVASGTYESDTSDPVLLLTQSITVTGGYVYSGGIWSDEPDRLNTTTLDGMGNGRVVQIAAGVSPIVQNFHIQNGQAAEGAGIYVADGNGAPLIRANFIHDNVASGGLLGGGGIFDGGGALIVENDIYNNQANPRGGGVLLHNNNPAVTSTLRFNNIYDNSATGLGGGVFLFNNARGYLVANTISQNSAGVGGGIGTFGGSLLVMHSNMLYDNTAVGATAVGGGFFSTGGSAVLWNNTIAGNTASANGAGVFLELGAEVEFYNNIIAFNVGSNNNGLHNASAITPSGSHNNIFGNASNVTFADPISGDPLFVNLAAFNLHIQADSPARNTGSPDTPAWVDMDIDGQERPNPDDAPVRHDVGADEYYPDFRRVNLAPTSLQVGVDRGETAVFQHTIRNTGSLEDSYDVTCSNDLWDVTCTTSVGPLAPGLSANITTAVVVPASAIAYQNARTIITATSQTDVDIFDRAVVDSRVNPIPGIAFTPSYSRTELPGAVITLTHVLTNTGDFDNFVVTVSSPGPNWGQVIPTDPLIIPLGPGATQQIRVRVTVPAQAPAGFANVTEITAYSQFNPAIAATVVNTVTAKATVGTRYVATSGSDTNNNCTQSDIPCRTIGRAVGQAATGDTVRIASGNYLEPEEISVNDTILISGGWNTFADNGQADDPTLTVISGSGVRRIFTVAPGATVRPTFEMLTLRNGSSGTAGGAVFVGNFARPTFRQVIFDNNQAAQGGALYLTNGATVSVRKSTFTNNTAQLSGGAIYLAGPGGALSLQQTRLLTNTASGGAATQGGGAIYLNGGTLAAQNNLFVNNTAVSHGGAIRAQSGQVAFGNNTVIANQAGGNGGGLYNNNATAEIGNTILISNTATDGGAVFAVSGETTLDYNNVWQNGGANQANVPVGPNSISADPLFLDEDFRLSKDSPAVDRGNPATVLAVDFEDDFRPSDQGFDIGWDELAGCRVKRGETIYGSIQDAVNADDPETLLLVSGICRGVHTIEVDGQVISQTVHLTQSLTIQGGWNGNFSSQDQESFVDPEGQGRAFYIFGDAEPIVEQLTIVNGDATGLGGGPDEEDAGGGVYVLDSAPTFRAVRILTGTAELGGGFYNHVGAPLLTYLALPDATAGEVITSLLQANTAVFGGAIYNYQGPMWVGAAWLVENEATAGGGLFNHSGALTVTNTILDRNLAANGGGIYHAAGDGAQYLHLTFYANAATEEGGAFYSETSTPTLRSSIFQGNLAAVGPAIFVAAGQPDEDYNYYHDHAGTAVVGLTIGPNSSESDDPPGLTDPAAGDFTLTEDAPAVDAGDPDSPVRRDFANNRRPSDQAPDMGAHELAGCLVQLNGEIYGSLQEALEAAQPGDQLNVSGRCSGVGAPVPGAGTGDACGAEMQVLLYLNKNVNLLGGWDEDFREREGYSILDARGLGRVVYIAPNITATIDGFDIINGFVQGSGPEGHGAGICIDNAQPTIRANRIYSNTAEQGGAVYSFGGAPLLIGGNRIFNNAAADGAGVYVVNATGFATLQNNFIYDNAATGDGGAFYSASGNNLIQHNTVVNNSVAGAGSAVVVLDGAPDVRGNIFLGNSAASGTIYTEDPAAPILGYNNYHQNSGGNLGGDLTDLGPGNLFVDPQLQGMATRVFTLTITSPVVDVPIPNMSLAIDYEEDIRPTDHGYDLGADEVGGCFAAIAGEESTVFGSVQQAVDLASPGDTVLVDGLCRNVAGRLAGSTPVTQTLFVDKELTINGNWDYDGDGITATLDALERGRVVYVASGAVVTLTQMTLQGGNGALGGGGLNGGGLYNAGALMLDGVQLTDNTAVFGGALYNTASLTLLDSEVLTNTATSGAGLYNNAPGSGAFSRGTEFRYNIATASGGGVYQASGGLMLDGNVLRNNSTGSNPGSGFGGAVYLGSEADVRNNYIYENRARVGGGVYNAAGNGRVWHNTFVQNQAFSGNGGGIASVAGNPDIRNNIVDRSSGSGIYTFGGLPVINYNNVVFNNPDYNTHVAIGPNNISAFPWYEDPLEKDYRLRPFSPGEDAGDLEVTNPANPHFTDRDYDGDIRPTNGAPDIGADEINLCLVKVGDEFFGVLQEAIDYAEMFGFNEVRIGRGICRGVQERNGTLQVAYVSQDLRIIGSMPRDNFNDQGDYYNTQIGHVTTIIDAENAGRALYVANDASPFLNQLAFVRGDAFAANDASSNDGGGIYNPGFGGVTFWGGYLSQNRAQNGGGFFGTANSVNDFSGLAVGLGSPGYDVITDEDSGDLLILFRTYFGNEVTNDGAGIYSSGTFDARNMLFHSNRAGNQGGGVFNTGADSRLVNGVFSTNRAQYDGGAVYNSGPDFRVYHNTIRSNQAISGTAGAIYNAAGGFLLNSSILYANTAFQEPGGLYSSSSHVGFMGYNNFHQNSPGDFSAGLVNANPIVGDPGFRNLGVSSLSVNSRNIDQADPTLLGSVPPDGDPLDYDHRNVPRPDGEGITYGVGDLEPPHGLFSDVGAFEYYKDFCCEIDPDNETASVSPGEFITFTLNIYNVGNPNYRQLIRDGEPRYWANGYTDTISITVVSSAQNWSLLEGGPEQLVEIGWDDLTQGDETFVTRVLTVSVPLTATTDLQELVEIRCASNSLRLSRATDTATFRVNTGSVGGVIVIPDYITTAVPGQILTFTHTVINVGNETESFSVTPSAGPRHATVLLRDFDTQEVLSGTIVTLAPEASYPVLLQVTILDTAAAGSVATPGVVAQSQQDLLNFGAALNRITIQPAPGTRYVAPGGANNTNCTDPVQPCGSLQYALSQAVAGDEILVAAGTYTEFSSQPVGGETLTQNLLINKSVTIRGGYDASDGFTSFQPITNAVTLDGQNERRVLYVTAGVSVTLQGLFIENGYSLPGSDATNAFGGGLYNAGADLTLYGVWLRNNMALYGAGLYHANGRLHLFSSVFAFNGNPFGEFGEGGGLYMAGGEALLENNTFRENAASRTSSRAALNASQTGNGGAIYLLDGSATLLNHIFSENLGELGDAVYISTTAVLTTNYNLFSNHSATPIDGPGNATIGDRLWTGESLFTDLYSHISVDSPALDRGTSDISILNGWDMDGQPRLQGPRVDLGADEYVQLPGFVLEPISQTVTIDPGDVYTFTHTLTNTGDFTDTYSLTVTHTLFPDWAAGWTFDFLGPFDIVDLPRGEAVTVTLVVTGGQAGSYLVSEITADSVSGLTASVVDTTFISQTAGVEIEPSRSGLGLPGETLVYIHTLQNSGNGLDEFDLSYTAVPADWVVTLSLTQTGFLQPGAIVPFTVTVQIPTDAISGTQHQVTVLAVATNPDASDTLSNTTTVGLLLNGLFLTPDNERTVADGVTVVYTHTLSNDSNANEIVDLSVAGLPAGWATTVSPPQVALPPFGEALVEVTVIVPPGTGGLLHTAVVTALGQATGLEATAVNTTTVSAQAGILLEPDQFQVVNRGELVTYEHQLTNLGNLTDTISLTAVSQQGWLESLTPASVVLGAGDSLTVTAVISVPLGATPGLEDALVITATSQSDPTVFDTATDVTRVAQNHALAFFPDHTETVDPGVVQVYQHTLRNDGDGSDTFALTWESEPDWPLVISPTLVTLEPDETTAVVMTLTVPTGAAGLTNVTTITATSTISPVHAAAVVNTTQVTGQPVTLGVAIAPDRSGFGYPGEMVQYQHTITNTGEGPDDYALTAVSSADWTVLVAPEQLTLAAGQSAAVIVWVTIPGTAVPGAVDQTIVTARSQTDPAVQDSATDTTRVRQTHGLLFAPDHDETAAPGSTIQYNHTLTNSGDGPDEFALTWRSAPDWGPVVTPLSVSLEPGESAQVTMTLVIPPGAGSLVNVTTITATSTISPTFAAAVVNRTTVTGAPANLGVEIAPDRAATGAAGTVVEYLHTVRNTGDVADAYEITAVSSLGWTVTVNPAQVSLNPGQTAPVTVLVSIPAGATPGAVDQTTVTARSTTNPAIADSAVDTTTVEGLPTETLIYLPVIAKSPTTPVPPTPTPTPSPTLTPTPSPTPRVCGDPTGIDLVVTGIQIVPGTPTSGQPAMVYVTIRNQGTVDVAFGNNFWLDFYVNRPPTPNTRGEIEWGVQGILMRAGHSETFSAPYTFSGGANQVWAQVDTDDTVDECPHEDNNRFGPMLVNVSGASGGGQVAPVQPDGPRQTPTPFVLPSPTPTSTPTPQTVRSGG